MSMKILIVETDWFFLRQARGFLEPRGHLTLYEPDPERALQRAEHWKPDVAIISAEREECCTGDVLERFARLRPRPAILLTAALARFGDAWRAWQHGGDELLLKPLVHTAELHAAIVAARENALCPRPRPLAARPAALSA